jgi:sulfopyruvate decarboxylase subunit beta
MTHDDYFRRLADLWADELVVCSLGTNANRWWTLTRSPGAFYMHAAMGFASSFALGLAVSVPHQRVWLLDSDGGVAMNLGGVLTEASLQPPNLAHFVLCNRCYQSLGGARLVNAERTDYVGIARGAGIQHCRAVETPGELEAAIRSVRTSGTYEFVVAEVEAEGSESAETAPSLPYEGPEIKYRFGRHIEEKLGITIFGPRGY